MQIAFRLEGSGSKKPQVKEMLAVDTDGLDPEEASELKGLVADSRVFDLPSHITSTAWPAADASIDYFLSVEICGQSHSVRITQPVEDPALKRLVKYLTNNLVA